MTSLRFFRGALLAVAAGALIWWAIAAACR